MTRVLVLSNFYPPHSHGGYELSCEDVMHRLARRGHEVTVLTSRYRRPGVDAEPASGVTVLRDLDLYWDDHRLVVPSRSRRARIELSNHRRLRDAMRASRPEVVSVWNMGAMSLGLLPAVARAGIPLVYAVCNDWLVWGRDMDAWTHGWRDRPPALGRAVERVLRLPVAPGDLGRSGTFLFVSEFIRRRAEAESGWRFPDADVVYSGISPDDFPVPDEAPAPRPWSWRLLFVGRLEEDKGVDTAVAALAHLPDQATLSVVGPGAAHERARVEEAVRRAGVSGRVSFDDLPRAALARRYRDADVLVFPSRWDEPFGLVPLEALACATPVVATRTGGSAEFLSDGGNCLAFGREDPAGLASAVARLAGDPALRARLIDGGLATARALSVDRLADSFEEWLVGAAEGFGAGRPAPRRLPVPPAGPAG